MVEGMVMELYKDHVIVMTKSGEFLKLRKRGNVNIGDIYKENIYRRIPVFSYAAAAALIFLVTSFAGYTAYANQIVGYVDIKGEKDVRLYVSRRGTVEKVDGIKNAEEIKNLTVNEAIEELNQIASVEGIYNDNTELDVSTTKVKDSKLDLNKVNSNVKQILSKNNKSIDKNNDKPEKELKDKENNNGNNGNNSSIKNTEDGNKIKENGDKQDNSSKDKIKNNDSDNKGKNKEDKNNDNNGNKAKSKNNSSKTNNKNQGNGLFNYIKSKYTKYFKNK